MNSPLVPLGGLPTMYPFPSSFPSLLSLTISVASQRKKIILQLQSNSSPYRWGNSGSPTVEVLVPYLAYCKPVASVTQSLSQASQVFIILKTHPGKDGCCIWRRDRYMVCESIGGGVIWLGKSWKLLVLTSQKRFATLILIRKKRFHSYRAETVFLCVLRIEAHLLVAWRLDYCQAIDCTLVAWFHDTLVSWLVSWYQKFKRCNTLASMLFSPFFR